MTMLYDPTKMQALISELADATTALIAQAENLDSAAADLQRSWQDNESFDGFVGAKNDFDREFGRTDDVNDVSTTIGCMHNLSVKVEQALLAMQHMDKKIAGDVRG